MTRSCPRCGTQVDEEYTVCPQCQHIMVSDEDPTETRYPDDAFPDGTVLAGDYRIVRTLGMGGAGIVYEARQISLENMPVAIKALHPDLNDDESAIILLKKEVIITRELSHDSIIKVFSLEKVEGRHFLVMEYVQGAGLQEIIDKHGKCSLEQVGPIFLRVCEALKYAHERGVIHLDIKPANILVLPSGMVKVCDFGIARMAIGGVTTATQRIITGSVGFMPPEQFRGRKFVSHRSDIYALGATLYNAITGEIPIGIIDFEGVPGCVLKAMQRKQEDRFDSVAEFRDAFIAETGISLPELAAGPGPAAGEPGMPPEEVESVLAAGPKPPEPVQVPAVAPPTKSEAEPVEEPIPEVQPRPEEPPAAAVPEPPVVEPPGAREEAPRPAVGPWRPIYVIPAVAAVVAAVIVVWLFASGKPTPPPSLVEDKNKQTATETPGPPERAAIPGTVPIKPTGTPTKADDATTEAVTQALSRFVMSLNFDHFDQAYSGLSNEFKERFPSNEFRREFFRSPRLWKTTVKQVDKEGPGKVLVKAECEVGDAHRDEIRKFNAVFEMTQQDAVWKVSNFHFDVRI